MSDDLVDAKNLTFQTYSGVHPGLRLQVATLDLLQWSKTCNILDPFWLSLTKRYPAIRTYWAPLALLLQHVYLQGSWKILEGTFLREVDESPKEQVRTSPSQSEDRNSDRANSMKDFSMATFQGTVGRYHAIRAAGLHGLCQRLCLLASSKTLDSIA